MKRLDQQKSDQLKIDFYLPTAYWPSRLPYLPQRWKKKEIEKIADLQKVRFLESIKKGKRGKVSED